ncbi:TPA: glycosyltransferase [Photobacterium damselae]|uniref:glycosyltransferase n=3 Tax=Photobacterium damselae TaxID=38293 RepID=UPI001EE13698|nr:glycosyltransferase [Photobacterium damselae]MCG3847074.1 glycosyltransferase family 4 protein [Photobacterium damselae]
MNESYDLLILTNLPSFYKINLYNELSKKKNIKVVFISNQSKIRNSDFMKGDINFDFEIITNKHYENRNKLFVFYKLFKLLVKTKVKQIIFSGWESIETTILMFLNSKRKNAIVIESSIIESSIKGIKGSVKKLIINRCQYAYPSGYLQNNILKELKFKGVIKITHGVGLLNESFYDKKNDKQLLNNKRFIYIGRLAKEKNLEFLINAFNINGLQLTIVGEGPEYFKLKEIARDNIIFSGYVNNDEVKFLLTSHDIFILPSISEPWGLVVEEALYSGLPVLVSENIGCKEDLVNELNSGLIFNPNDIVDLNNKIDCIIKNYSYFFNNVSVLRYQDRVNKQIKAYL